jgi:hypothetical protein
VRHYGHTGQARCKYFWVTKAGPRDPARTVVTGTWQLQSPFTVALTRSGVRGGGCLRAIAAGSRAGPRPAARRRARGPAGRSRLPPGPLPGPGPAVAESATVTA